MISRCNSSQSTLPTGRVLWEELFVLSRTSRQVEFLSPELTYKMIANHPI